MKQEDRVGWRSWTPWTCLTAEHSWWWWPILDIFLFFTPILFGFHFTHCGPARSNIQKYKIGDWTSLCSKYSSPSRLYGNLLPWHRIHFLLILDRRTLTRSYCVVLLWQVYSEKHVTSLGDRQQARRPPTGLVSSRPWSGWSAPSDRGANIESSPIWDIYYIINEVHILQRAISSDQS